MTANASRGGYSVGTVMRAFAWFLCMLVAVSMAGSRFVRPVAGALVSSYAVTHESRDGDSGGACDDAECDPSEADDSEEQADSDEGTEEVPTVPDVRISFARVASSELTIAYTGKPCPGYSSPAPKPAEPV